jgi:hypothetical protein
MAPERRPPRVSPKPPKQMKLQNTLGWLLGISLADLVQLPMQYPSLKGRLRAHSTIALSMAH